MLKNNLDLMGGILIGLCEPFQNCLLFYAPCVSPTSASGDVHCR